MGISKEKECYMEEEKETCRDEIDNWTNDQKIM